MLVFARSDVCKKYIFVIGADALVRGSQCVFPHLGDQESSLRTDNRPTFDQSLVNHGPEISHDVEDTEYRLFSFNPPQEFLLLEIELHGGPSFGRMRLSRHG
jgi:hypothetical protein